jgi:DNA-directed RNA polymerase specialized sigma24 family protein
VRASRRPEEVPLDDVAAQLALPEQERPNVRELLRALGRLPFNQRSAIAMRELEGRSYDEIADTLGVTVPAVEALLVRARRALRVQRAAVLPDEGSVSAHSRAAGAGPGRSSRRLATATR